MGLLVGWAEVARGPGDGHPKLSSHVEMGISWDVWSDVTCCAPLQEHWATFLNPSVGKEECLHLVRVPVIPDKS